MIIYKEKTVSCICISENSRYNIENIIHILIRGHVMEDNTKIYEMLRAKGFRVTAQKKIILDIFLANKQRMLSVNDVYNMLPENTSIDNATVYRNIQKFLGFGILESMNDEQGINRYTVYEREHHHYLICTECGKIIKFPCENHYWKDCALENHFIETHHKLEVYGMCFECSKSKK